MQRVKLLALRVWWTAPWGTVIAFIVCVVILLLLLLAFQVLSLSPSDAPPTGTVTLSRDQFARNR